MDQHIAELLAISCFSPELMQFPLDGPVDVHKQFFVLHIRLRCSDVVSNSFCIGLAAVLGLKMS